MYIPCHQTENQNNFRQGTLENDWTSTSELERNVASYTPTSPVPEMNLWIYWSEQSFTGFGTEDLCSSYIREDPPFFSLHTETTLQITRSNPAYFDRKHKSGLHFLHSFYQLNQIILITVLLFRISRPSIFSGVTVSLWKYRVWGCRISSIGNQTGYSTIDQYRHSLAELMNFSKNKNVWP